ncbi:FAD dependent oxidoreductase [Scenedesmus sp. NREL 46B-D3]|nr:FAD dependent oxidoreductase [Scenedesmus sp. NREL 46B-D3]
MAKVVVIGAGIIGASISRQLAQRGAQVTVLEAAAAPAQGATKASWAWLNSNYKQPQHYKDFNIRSMQLWQQQHSDLATFCGCLMLHDERPDPQDPAYPMAPVPAEQLLQLEPALSPELAASASHARLFPAEGWCDPDEATRSFLQDAQQLGAQVLLGHKVEAITIDDGKATQVACSTSQPEQQQQQGSSYTADAVVVAAGTGCPELAAQAGCQLPLLHKPAAIVMTSPLQPGLLRHMVISDTVFMLQRRDGRVLLGETRPEEASNTDDSSSNAQRILALAAAAVPALASAGIEGIYIGYRPYPADGHPVLGWVGGGSSNVYVAVTHSGMTLAPLVGQLVAEEVMAAVGGGSRGSSSSSASRLLAPYRPSRQFQVDGSGVRWADAAQAGTR